MSQLDPIVNQPALYANGCVVSNDATTPNTKVDISAGIVRDSNNIIDMNLGNYLGLSGIGTANSATVLNAAVNGINGLDTGSLAASSVYAVYVIGDSSAKKPVGTLLSLSLSAPLLPFGYDSIRIVGYAVTDGSSHFLLAYQSGSRQSRQLTFDAYKATSVTAGTSATYAAIDLSTIVPAIDQLPVRFEINWTANAAADSFNMQGGNATGDQWTVTAPVAGSSAHTVAFGQVLAQLVSGVPKSNYKVSAVGGVAINVAGFLFDI